MVTDDGWHAPIAQRNIVLVTYRDGRTVTNWRASRVRRASLTMSRVRALQTAKHTGAKILAILIERFRAMT